MVQKVLVLRVSDLSGTELGEDEGRTVTFAIGSDVYEMDLTDDEAGAFFDVLQPYTAAATKVAGRGARKPGGRASARRDQSQTKAIKAWADEQGLGYPKRGRLPADLVSRYEAAHK